MNNKIKVKNSKREKFRAGVWIAALLLLWVAVVAFSSAWIHHINLNGLVQNYQGTVSYVDIPDGKVVLDGKIEFNMSRSKTLVNWYELLGKQVKILSPQKHAFNADPWVLGLIVDDVVLVDFDTSIQEERQESVKIFIGTGVVGGVLLVVLVALAVALSKQNKEEDCDIALMLSQMLAMRQPPCKQAKKIYLIFTICYAVVLVLATVALCLVEDRVENLAVQIAVAVAYFVLILGEMLSIIFVAKFALKKEIEFYNQNYPFDFNDISHAPLKKAIKEQLQQQNMQQQQLYPDNFAELGNGFDAEFVQDGIILRDEDDMLDEFIAKQKQGIFDEFDDKEQQQGVYCCKISYDDANFVALPFYSRRGCPLFVIVKSRLQDDKSDLKADMHFAFDKNLLATLQKFGVEVEGLDDILANKEQLMLENCPKAKRQNFSLPINLR